MAESKYITASDEQLAAEAEQWASGRIQLEGWVHAPEAVPRYAESTSISVSMPSKMLEILQEFARREGVGVQVLMNRWLHDRIMDERSKLSPPVEADSQARLTHFPPAVHKTIDHHAPYQPKSSVTPT